MTSRAAARDPEWAFLGERVAMISPFPPVADGVARYAEQLACHLTEEGRDVLRVGLENRGGGDVLVDPYRPGGLLRALRPTRGREVVIQWFWNYYVLGRAPARLGRWLALAVLLRLRRCTVVFHEPEDARHETTAGARRLVLQMEERLRTLCWRAPLTPVFHSAWEREAFERRFRRGRRRPARIVTHGRWFAPEVSLSQAEARAALGLDPEGVVFLCIGFITERKGFDRAARAFVAAGETGARLYIVGSLIENHPDSAEQLALLRSMADEHAEIELLETYVDDATFDTWLRAADVLLLPYRTAASSSVVARAHLLGTRVVSSAVGGIAEQLREGDRAVRDDDELRGVIADLARAPSGVDEHVADPGGD